MDGGEGEEGHQLWVQCLHQAEEEQSHLTRSFWLGKFLQALPKGVLLSCRRHSSGQQEHRLPTKHALVFPDQQTVAPHNQGHQQQQQTEGDSLQEKVTSVAAATESVRVSNEVILRPAGRLGEPLWLHVWRADVCVRSSGGGDSCSSLSPAVRRLVVESAVAGTAPQTLLRPDHTLDWAQVEIFLGAEVVCEGSDYAEGALKCVALARCVSHAVGSAPHDTLWSGLFSWTGNQQLFVECVQLLLRSGSDHVSSQPELTHISLLTCCAGLERALGDSRSVRLSCETSSPLPNWRRSLGKLLPACVGLYTVLQMCCLRCLIGPPSGLNLRNLFWHGFPCPGEISSDCVCLLLAVAASLGLRLASAAVEMIHRPPLSLHHEEAILAGTFPVLSGGDVECVEKLFAASFFVPPSTLPLWLAGLTAFKERRYHHSLSLLLPCLEHGLRRVFACVNHCPHRVLTAESTVLYTTFDEILCPTLSDLSPNRLHHEISPEKLECLLDLLVQPEGPRLRDRISHGEVDFYSLSECLASHVVSLLVLFCAQYSLDPSLTSEPPIAKCLAIEKSYRSLFHPLSLLKRELIQLTRHLETWSVIPLPQPNPPSPPLSCSTDNHPTSEPHTQQPVMSPPPSPHGSSESSPLPGFGQAIHRLVLAASGRSLSLSLALQQVTDLSHEAGLSETDQFSAVLKGLVESVWDQLGSSRRPHGSRAGLELTGLLRRTTENMATTACQVRDTAVLRHGQQQLRQLRSRQRKNYEHLLTSLPLYRAAVCLLVVMMAVTLLHLHLLTRTDTAARKATKFYRRVLQVSENLSSQSVASRNRWEEADQLVLSLTQLSLQDILPTTDTGPSSP